jgi:hypothetical protein
VDQREHKRRDADENRNREQESLEKKACHPRRL